MKTKDNNDDDDSDSHPTNKWMLQLNATVCDADIMYSSNPVQLNESCKKKVAVLMDKLCYQLEYIFDIRH